MAKKVRLSDLVLRDAHQSLHSTRMTTADMLPACAMLDRIGFCSLEAWGGATFDSCIRFLNEDPWERLRSLKKALPCTPIMMPLRGQCLLGYRQYADDVVDQFIESAAKNGVGVFRIFDALNDPRNLKRAVDAAKRTDTHVQLAVSYATTPYHTIGLYTDLVRTYAELGADSICIKDMAGLLKPYDAKDLVESISAVVGIPIQIHTHATTGMSVATLVKAAEAGADVLDTVISPMSMGTSLSPTETIVEILKGTDMDTGLDISALRAIADYFRDMRKRYAQFESSFLGADTRILVSQVPGGMISILESQLKEQGASGRIDDVLKEIPLVQKDCGYIPLVAPTSQIVGTQALLNVLFGRYTKLTGETRDLLTGKYGKLPAACNTDLVRKALKENNMDEVITRRPADLIPGEFEKIAEEAKANGSDGSVEDALTYAMFPKIAPKFFRERASGPLHPCPVAQTAVSEEVERAWIVSVNGCDYNVVSGPAGDAMNVSVNGIAYSIGFRASGPTVLEKVRTEERYVRSPVTGILLNHCVENGSRVKKTQKLILIESMKMELEIQAPADGIVNFVVSPGSPIVAGQVLAELL